MKKSIFFLIGFTILAAPTHAAPPAEWQKNITFVHELEEFYLPLKKYPEFFVQKTPEIQEKTVCVWEKEEENTEIISHQPQEEIEPQWIISDAEVTDFVQTHIAEKINRDAENVRIFTDENGAILFEGAGRFGQDLDIPKTVALAKKAIVSEDVRRVELPVKKINPRVDVEDEEMKKSGIQELIAVGESDFTGSSWDRMTNIQVGSNTMNGVLIPKGEVMSFNEHLGPVTAREGYVPELVILGPKVDKEYGGGLCQVSSTAFRMALLAGLPIVERWQHSFAVSYYKPWGTDATIYPGSKDMKFENNTDGALLIQTTMHRDTKKLRFHLYGTKDERKSKMFFSGTYNQKGALAPKYETSTAMAPGTVKRFSSAVKGFDTQWYRVVEADPEKMQSEENTEEKSQPVFNFFSRYQPRGEWVVRGVAPTPVEEEKVVDVSTGPTI